MKKNYVVEIAVDFSMVVFALWMYLFPSVSKLSPNGVFYLIMGTYAGFALLEYIFDHSKYEPLCLFFASGVAAFSAYFLDRFNTSYVLSITIATWITTIAIIKIMYLSRIPIRYNTLFIIRLALMSMVILYGLLISINIFYNTSYVNYMLASLYLVYGILEIIGDYSSYLEEEGKLKEYGSIRTY